MLLQARQAAGLHARSELEILAAEADLYVARCEGRAGALLLKLGSRYDMGRHLPAAEDGWTRGALRCVAFFALPCLAATQYCRVTDSACMNCALPLHHLTRMHTHPRM